ncbi:MAG: MMPL family transporter, partial [Clostridia bacterium]|nr:MMPL family transporter [Clostridia bacterium]
MRASRAVVKYRVVILILALALLIPSFFGMVNTRINYDMLDYLPDDMDTVTGQNLLMEDFGKGAFSLIVVEDMPSADIRRTAEKLRTIEHVETVVCYEDLADPTIPKALLPESIYKEFNSGDSTLMAVFFDTSTSADATMDAIREVRNAVGKQCFVTGMSALVTDLKDLCEEEEPVYVALAVVCACASMMLLLDSWLVPFVFLASIGMSILMNLGSNWFLGEISYITKALSAVLQLAVTMDYSIFLWHSYNEKRASTDDKYEAMAQAIHDTFVSVLGSSITTIAGFIALCFMTFTMGRDLGIVMAKGVLLGVIGCVTILPSLILLLDKPLQKTRHRALIPTGKGFAKWVVKVFPVFLVIFALLLVPSYYGYSKTNDEVYYDMGE